MQGKAPIFALAALGFAYSALLYGITAQKERLTPKNENNSLEGRGVYGEII